MAKRALITGVGGFIGSHLAERLLRDDWCVDGLDHRPDSERLGAARQQIGLLRSGRTIESLRDWEVERGYYDAIFHLAARVGPSTVVEDPLTMLAEHARHTEAVCELGARTQAVVVLASSSEVYQWNGDGLMHEDDALTIGPSHMPRCGYAISKLHMEHTGLAYWRQRGVPVIVARLFNVAGARQRHRFVLPIFAKAALLGGPLPVHGDGAQLRTFTHVADTVEALTRLVGVAAAHGEVVNVAAREPCLAIGSVARRVIEYVGAHYDVDDGAAIVQTPYDATGDAAWERMNVRRPDVAKLQALTGLRFPNRWDDILRDVCADWAARLGIASRAEPAKSVQG
ncbi:MAG: NAD-dependent epimerase/dehydratase family protein [bacterium]